MKYKVVFSVNAHPSQGSAARHQSGQELTGADAQRVMLASGASMLVNPNSDSSRAAIVPEGYPPKPEPPGPYPIFPLPTTDPEEDSP